MWPKQQTSPANESSKDENQSFPFAQKVKNRIDFLSDDVKSALSPLVFSIVCVSSNRSIESRIQQLRPFGSTRCKREFFLSISLSLELEAKASFSIWHFNQVEGVNRWFARSVWYIHYDSDVKPKKKFKSSQRETDKRKIDFRKNFFCLEGEII